MDYAGFVINAQQEKLNKLIDSSSPVIAAIMRTTCNGIAIFDKNGELLYVNNICLTLLEISDISSVENLNLTHVLNSDLDLISRLHKGETIGFDTNSKQSVFLSSDINLHYFRVSITPIYNENNNISGYFGIITNMSDFNKNENALKFQSEQLNRLNTYIEYILKESNVSLWRIYFEDEEHLKLSGDLLLGKMTIGSNNKPNKDLFIDYLLPSDKAKFKSMISKVLKEGNENMVCTDDLLLKEPTTGEDFYLRYTLTSVNNNGQRDEIICAFHNVTDIMLQKKEIEISDFKSRLLIQGGGLVPWEFDVETQTLTYEGGVLGKENSISDLMQYLTQVDDIYYDKVSLGLSKLSKGEDVTIEIDYSYTPKGQENQVFLKTYFTPYSKNNDGKVTRYVGYTKNITESTQLLKELAEAKAYAETADKLKSMFLANMSHEIRTPLNAIVGFSEMLSFAKTSEEKQKWQRYIFSNSEQLLHLISDILDLSKIEAGTLSILNEEFDLSRFFEEIAYALKSRVINKDIEFIISNPYREAIICTDKNRVAQIISNFTTNAIKHTSKGYIKVGYELSDGYLRLFVKDTGRGISLENQARLFSRFEKLDTNTPGTGLGLAITKAIVNILEGECGCESTEGKGSYFWAHIPIEIININNSYQGKKEDRTVEFRPSVDAIPKGTKILIAEDNEANYELISSILQDFILTRAHNGVEALEFAKTREYDIILMDIRMPIMNGYVAIEKIRDFDKLTPIIVLTSNAYECDKLNTFSLGATDYITKPLRRDVVLNSISKYLKEK